MTEPFCADLSRADGEPLAATASRVDRWLAVEYRGVWAHDALAGSVLTDAVKERLRAFAARRRSRVLFVRRRERRAEAGIAVFAARSAERGSVLRRFELDAYGRLLQLRLADGEALDRPLFLVCTHGKHDPCCARYGRPLYEALREQVEPGWAWQSTHVGGDRFAGNVVVLPHGLYYGRVEPGEAAELVEATLAGRILLERYRGRSCHPFPVQAAERAVREATGLLGIDDLRLAGTWPGTVPGQVRFDAGGELWEVAVERRAGPLTHLTCKARALRHPRRYAAASPPARVA